MFWPFSWNFESSRLHEASLCSYALFRPKSLLSLQVMHSEIEAPSMKSIFQQIVTLCTVGLNCSALVGVYTVTMYIHSLHTLHICLTHVQNLFLHIWHLYLESGCLFCLCDLHKWNTSMRGQHFRLTY